MAWVKKKYNHTTFTSLVMTTRDNEYWKSPIKSKEQGKNLFPERNVNGNKCFRGIILNFREHLGLIPSTEISKVRFRNVFMCLRKCKHRITTAETFVSFSWNLTETKNIRSNGNASNRHETANGNTSYPSCFRNGFTCFRDVSDGLRILQISSCVP